MDIRVAKKEDLESIQNIWQYCFNDPEGFFNYYFKNKYNEDNTIVIEVDGEIVSSLQLNQYSLSLNSKLYDVSYVVGVSTLPEARGRGFMEVLMNNALNEMYKRNQLISILMPIDYRLYRKYGYEHCYDQIEYGIDVEYLKNFKLNGNFKKASLEDIDDISHIYHNCLKNKNGYVIRDKNYYENLFKEVHSENGHVYIHESNDTIDGYIVYFIQENNLFVREVFYENMNVLSSFLKFIYNHNTQCKKVSIYSYIDDNIRHVISNPKDIEIKIKPFMMGRIINFEGFMKNLEFDKNINCNFNIKLEDNYIQENNNTFGIFIKNGNVDVNKVSEDADLIIDINTLSQLAFSYMDVEEVLFFDKIKVNNKKYVDILKSLFNKKINYINEYV